MKMLLTDEQGNKKVFFGNGTLRIHCCKTKIENIFDGFSLLIFGNQPAVEPGIKTNEKLSLKEAEIILFFQDKEDLKPLKAAIDHIENCFENV